MGSLKLPDPTMSKQVALLGYPVRHSISPAFQQAAFDFLKLDVRYEPWEVEPARLREAVERLRGLEMLGANVTIPHKETVLPLLDSLDPLAERIGAVNTIVNHGGRLSGHNTDAEGMVTALRREGGFDPSGKAALLLGAGGVARAAGFALLGAGVASLGILNRTLERAEALAVSLREKAAGAIPVTALPWQRDSLLQALQAADLLVNCTSVGMKHGPDQGRSPLPARVLRPGSLVYDLVYNPARTPLLEEAQRAGARGLGGLPMLVYQGAAAFELWTGEKAPLPVMMQAARKALP